MSEMVEVGAAPGGHEDLLSTVDLLAKVKAGDRSAVETLVARCLPPLQRWARGRLPAYARQMLDTNDLVQETLLRTLRKIDSFEAREVGALNAYLRRVVVNQIRDEIRRAGRRPSVELTAERADEQASPLEEAIGSETLARYEAALGRLRADEREAIVERVELENSYEEISVSMGKPSADAARMAVARALVKLAEEMGHDE